MNFHKTILAIIAFAVASLPANAALTLTINNFNTSSIDFSISGTIDSGATIGMFNTNVIYIGVPGNASWVNSAGSQTSMTNNGSPDNSATFADSAPFTFGDYTAATMSGLLATNQSIDFNAVVSGSFNPGNINVADMIVTAGRNGTNPFPDPATQVGSAIPEPSTYTFFLGLVALGAIACRRVT